MRPAHFTSDTTENKEGERLYVRRRLQKQYLLVDDIAEHKFLPMSEWAEEVLLMHKLYLYLLFIISLKLCPLTDTVKVTYLS